MVSCRYWAPLPQIAAGTGEDRRGRFDRQFTAVVAAARTGGNRQRRQRRPIGVDHIDPGQRVGRRFRRHFPPHQLAQPSWRLARARPAGRRRRNSRPAAAPSSGRDCRGCRDSAAPASETAAASHRAAPAAVRSSGTPAARSASRRRTATDRRPSAISPPAALATASNSSSLKCGTSGIGPPSASDR